MSSEHQTDESSAPLAYATPHEMRLIAQAFQEAITRVRDEVACQTYSEMHGRQQAIDLLQGIADGYEARAKESDTP